MFSPVPGVPGGASSPGFIGALPAPSRAGTVFGCVGMNASSSVSYVRRDGPRALTVRAALAAGDSRAAAPTAHVLGGARGSFGKFVAGFARVLGRDGRHGGKTTFSRLVNDRAEPGWFHRALA
jgi:hypothetical protein